MTLCVWVCVGVCVGVCMFMWVPMCYGVLLKVNFRESRFSPFYYVGSRNQTRVTRLGNKHFYLLCCAGTICSEFDNLFTTLTHSYNFFPHTTKVTIRHSNEMLNGGTLFWGSLFYLTSGTLLYFLLDLLSYCQYCLSFVFNSALSPSLFGYLALSSLIIYISCLYTFL